MLANIITFIRFCLLFPLLYYIRHDYMLMSSVIMLISIVTDALDGYVARRYNSVTKLGEIFDPLVDKVFLLSILILYVEKRYIGSIFVTLILIREFFIGGLRSYIQSMEDKILPAKWHGKIKTITQDIALFVILIFRRSVISNIFLILVTVMTMLSGFIYLISGLKRLRSGVK